MSATWYLPPTDLILTLLHSQQKIYGRNANVKAQTLRVRKWLSRHSASQAHANWKVRPWHLVFYQTFLTFELPVSLSSVGVTMNLQCSHSIIAVLSPALVTKPLWAKTVVPYAVWTFLFIFKIKSKFILEPLSHFKKRKYNNKTVVLYFNADIKAN